MDTRTWPLWCTLIWKLCNQKYFSRLPKGMFKKVLSSFYLRFTRSCSTFSRSTIQYNRFLRFKEISGEFFPSVEKHVVKTSRDTACVYPFISIKSSISWSDNLKSPRWARYIWPIYDQYSLGKAYNRYSYASLYAILSHNLAAQLRRWAAHGLSAMASRNIAFIRRGRFQLRPETMFYKQKLQSCKPQIMHCIYIGYWLLVSAASVLQLLYWLTDKYFLGRQVRYFRAVTAAIRMTMWKSILRSFQGKKKNHIAVSLLQAWIKRFWTILLQFEKYMASVLYSLLFANYTHN